MPRDPNTGFLVAWDFQEAYNASEAAKSSQRECQERKKVAHENLAKKEQTYRVALALAITRYHAKGTAWTVCGDMARGEKEIAQLRFERDVAKGIVAAAEEEAWQHTADRKDVQEFITWSRIVAPLGQQQQTGHQSQAIGGRRG